MAISEVTRRNIFDELNLEKTRWSGNLEETEFLSRLYKLSEIASTDHRFPDAEGDIWQHRINNDDWDEYWVFTDGRFELLNGSDEIFLMFLCEMLHPVVQPVEQQVETLLAMLNKHLVHDGWEIVAKTRISNRPVFVGRQLLKGAPHALSGAKRVADVLDASYITQQITRIESAIETDPELAIGTAKEFVESICKSILEERGARSQRKDDFPGLVRSTIKALEIAPDDIPDKTKAVDTIRRLLNNLATVSNGLAELRNPYGTGHGKLPTSKGLRPRHARLAVGAAIALAVFLFDTHTERRSS